MNGVKFTEVVNGDIVRHYIDQVGNNLTATLVWCATHLEPVWQYHDGSYECPHTTVVGWSPDPHDMVAWPFGGES